MSDTEKEKGKIEIKIGNLSFSAEGNQEWLGEQLSKVLESATPVMAQSEAPGQSVGDKENAAPSGPFTTSLAAYIKAKNGEANQVQRFLATAGWLFRRGNKDLATAMVSKALTENHQKRLANPADCLNKNCSKGYCEKQKGHFYITPEGWKALGDEQ
jgi:hypothetical protein